MTQLLKEVDLLGDNIPWLHDFRQQGKLVFSQTGVPNAKVEAWKYTKPNMFLEGDFVCSNNSSETNYQANIPFDCYKVCFVNGVFAPRFSNFPNDIEIMPLIEAIMLHPDIRKNIGNLADINRHPFAALNAFYLNEGIYIHIPEGFKPDKPIVLIYHTETGGLLLMQNLRNLVILEKEAQAEIIEYFDYAGELKSCYFNNIVNEIYLEEQANLQHYKIQDEAFKAIHLALSCVNSKKDSVYKSFCLQKGADLARNESAVDLIENGAYAEVNAVYMMNGWATLDITTEIRHLASETYSQQLVKGVVGDQAKGIFQGKIHIAQNAIKTKGWQQHRALLLSDDAEVDVKPELEIYADDVQCSHGSACGEIDAEQLFYMKSRGMSEDVAKKMLINAYIEEVIAKVDDEKISNWIRLLLKLPEENY